MRGNTAIVFDIQSYNILRASYCVTSFCCHATDDTKAEQKPNKCALITKRVGEFFRLSKTFIDQVLKKDSG